MSFRYTDSSKGYDELKAKINRFKAKPGVQIGVLREDMGKPYLGHRGALSTIGEVAFINEFGSVDGKIPERPFIRGYFDGYTDDIKAQLSLTVRRILLDKGDMFSEFDRLGRWATAGMQRNITDGGKPAFVPNAPMTIRLKGSSKPLVDTGQLWSTITHKVLLNGDV